MNDLHNTSETLSTRNLAPLLEIAKLEALSRSLALLDAIMSPNWQYRYFLFDPAWDIANDERLATLDNGSGDGYFLVFGPSGAFLKGFDHESEFTPWAHDPLKVQAGVLDQVPEAFTHYLSEPAFDMESTTFCIWRETNDVTWHCGHIDFPPSGDPDGSEGLLWLLNGNPATYIDFALEYYERSIHLTDVEMIYRREPLTRSRASRLNPEADWKQLLEFAKILSYPVKE